MKYATGIVIVVGAALSTTAARQFSTVAGDALALARLPAPATSADFLEDGAPSEFKIELGRLLFFDRILSGNRNIACATCHHPALGTGDRLALGLGEGAEGLGPKRSPGHSTGTGVHARIPRNAPGLWNLGAREFTALFHDGRVEIDRDGFYEGGFITPAKWKLPTGLDNVLAAQAMFPVMSPDKMAGQKGENEIAEARSLNNAAGPGGVWQLLSERLQEIPEYVVLFEAAFPDRVVNSEDVTYVLAANAIAAFESDAFRADDSRFDRYLRGLPTLADREVNGMDLFFGKANCSTCHSGVFQTDHSFHAIAMPQIGPGKADGSDASYWSASGERAFLEDHGRGRVTVRREDNFKFRTPSLRNVELSAPYGHDGAYATLEEVVRHHLDPAGSLARYRLAADHLPRLDGVLETTMRGSQNQRWLSRARLEDYLMRDSWVQSNDVLRARIAEANQLAPVDLADEEIADVLAFLRSLTDESTRDLEHLVPRRVPSGLPVDR